MDETRKPPVGAKPGTLAIDPDAPKPRMKIIRYSEGDVEERELEDVGDLVAPGPDEERLWLDVQGLGDETVLRRLADIFSIHPLALEDIVHVPVRPKVEPYASHTLIVSRMPRTEGTSVSTEQTCIFLGANYVLTFQESHGDVLDPVRRRLHVAGSMMRRSSSDYLAYAILDTIIDAYYPIVESLGDRVEALEERVLVAASPATLRELNEIKGTLLHLRRSVTPQREAVNALIRDENELVSSTVRTYLRDTYDHIVQTAEAVETARELVNGLLNTYLSVVSNRMNEVMRTLTIVATIFIPLTFLAGIYGMNFDHMPELHQRWGYPVLLTTMLVVGVAMVLYFRRKGWLDFRE